MDGKARPWYSLGEVPAVQAEAWGSPPARSPRSCGHVPAAFPALPTAAIFVDGASPAALAVGLKGQSQKEATYMPCRGRDPSQCALCVSLLKKHVAKLLLHPQRGAAPGLLGAQVAALLCPAESMGWEHGFPRPSWGREDACRELGSGMAGPETPPASLQRAALSGCWAVQGWRGLWLLQSLFLGLALQSCPRGSSLAGMRGSRQVCAGADPAALLIAPGLLASCVTGPGRVGAGTAGGLWSSSSPQHLGDGAS